jgi:DMSO/TMAO reductase YedYZ molybdopterin-dependent catalytic subunit
MERIAPKPPMIVGRKRIGHVLPAQLTERLTPLGTLFETSSMGVPDVNAAEWKLEVTGLVDCQASLSFNDLISLPKRTLESVFVCSGNPAKPTIPLRRAANVKWGGVSIVELLDRAGIRHEATHLWSYGLDHGTFYGVAQHHYVKDMPLARLKEDNVLIAYELNDQPLMPKNGFPARLVVPGYYGTNCVKWLCRLALVDRRASEFQTIKMYSDLDLETDSSGKTGKPVWDVAPESIIVSPKPKSKVPRSGTEIWGWAWSTCAVRSVEISLNGGRSWIETSLQPANGLSWQRFSHLWSPERNGSFNLLCRALDLNGSTQPADGARNAVYSMRVIVED